MKARKILTISAMTVMVTASGCGGCGRKQPADVPEATETVLEKSTEEKVTETEEPTEVTKSTEAMEATEEIESKVEATEGAELKKTAENKEKPADDKNKEPAGEVKNNNKSTDNKAAAVTENNTGTGKNNNTAPASTSEQGNSGASTGNNANVEHDMFNPPSEEEMDAGGIAVVPGSGHTLTDGEKEEIMDDYFGGGVGDTVIVDGEEYEIIE